MKYIELIYKIGSREAVNVSKIENVSYDGDLTVWIYTACTCACMPFESKSEAKINYENIRNYCINYGPTPDTLVIGEE